MAGLSIDISNSIIFSPHCREVILPLGGEVAYPLTSRGVELSGLSHLHPPYEVRRTGLNFQTVIYTLAGRARYETLDEEGSLRPGDLWIVPARSTFRYWADGPWHILWFHIGATHAHGAAGVAGAEVRKALHAEHLRQAMERYVSESMPGDAVSGRVAQAYAEIIMGLLEKDLQAGDRRHSRLEQQLNILWEKVHADLRHPWTVEELARRAHVSAPHLYRLTRQYTGLAPMGKVTQLRMQHAAQLLAGSDYTLEEIATRIGYESPFSFSRIFKKQRGVSPAAYRQSRRRG